MDYKEIFYKKYVSTHTEHRKGVATINEFRDRAKAYQKQFGQIIPDNKEAKILDIGCGNGSIVWWLQQSGYKQASGFDISQEQIDVGKKLGVENIFVADLLDYLKQHSSEYDVLILRDLVEHFPKSEALEIISLCNNALKDNGIIIIQVPNGESPFFGRIRYGDFTHDESYTQSSMFQILSVHGFDEVKSYPVTPVFLTIFSPLRVVLWKIVEAAFKIAIYSEVGKVQPVVTQSLITTAKKVTPASANE